MHLECTHLVTALPIYILVNHGACTCGGVEADLLGLFVSGLKTNVPSIGTITEVKVANSDVSLADIRFCFPTVSILKICLHRHKEDFSDYIVHNTSLTELVISDTPLGPNFLLLLLPEALA